MSAAEQVVRERPILFSGPMVRAIIEGRKTQTRRIMKPQPPSTHDIAEDQGNYEWEWTHSLPLPGYSQGSVIPWNGANGICGSVVPPHGKPGDRLWVRESFQPLLADDVEWSDADYETGEGYAVNYVATGGVKEFYDFSKDESLSDRITPSIFMPRWASRITLEITDVRVHRLQEISEEDVKAEGVDALVLLRVLQDSSSYTVPFQILWDSIHGEGAWNANPWVWVYAFKRL